MFAHAKLRCHFDARLGCTRVGTLRSDGPLLLRKSNPKGPEPLTARRGGVARIALAAGAAGPVGGDSYRLDVTVGAGSTLLLQEVSAMLVLPGSEGRQSEMQIRVDVEPGASFVWWAEPIIAAARCHHRHDIRIHLAGDSRLVMREELLLGRHGETPGDLASRLRITRGGVPLYDQETRFGPAAEGWRGAAVLGGNRAVGSVLAVDPSWDTGQPDSVAYHRDAALAALPGPGVAVSAVAADSHALRGLLNAGLNRLGPPWGLNTEKESP